MDANAGDQVILASNTSSYNIGELADAASRHREQVIGAHWSPSPITPCVEVVVSRYTAPSVLETTMALMKRVGKFPTRCKSAPGFVANRIQFAMAAEACADGAADRIKRERDERLYDRLNIFRKEQNL